MVVERTGTILYINNNSDESLRTENGNSRNLRLEAAETSAEESYSGNNDAGFAPISPETPSWGPPSGDNDAGFAPISPETPSWGPPSGDNDAGFAPISPETPSWGPPSSGSNNTGSITISPGTSWSGCTGCAPVIFPTVVIPGQTGQTTTGQSNVRFLYAATGQLPVNIRLGGRTVINRLQFGNFTPYYLENSGYRTVQVFNSSTGFLLYQGSFYFNNGTAYTISIVNNGSGISLLQLTDMPCRNQNSACVRAVNLSPNSGPTDVFLSGIGRVFQNVNTFGVTNYRAIRQGSYRAAVSESTNCPAGSSIFMADTYVECSNTRVALLASSNVTFMNGVTYTLYTIGRAYQLPSVQLLSLESDLVY